MKLFSKITTAIVGIALAAGVGVAASGNKAKAANAAEVLSYKLDFAANSTDTDNNAALGTNVADYFVAGADYVSSLASSKVYLGKSSMNGLKFGSSSVKGTLTLTLASSGQVKATKIRLALAMYDSGQKVKVSINSASSGTGYSLLEPTTSLADYDVAWDGATNLSTINIESNVASKCRFYLDYIEVYVDDGGGSCDHNWVAGTVHNPTCTEEGYTEYQCSLCGETKHDNVTAALGHDFGNWEVTTEPTCTEPGSQTRVCSRDSSHVEVEPIAALGHNFVDGICTVCGAEQPSEVTVGYVFSEHYSADTEIDGVTIAADSNVSFVFAKREGGNATKYYANGTAARWYGGGTFTVSSTAGNILSIDVVYSRHDNAVTVDVGSYSDISSASGTGTWTGESSAVVFTQAGTTGHDRISSLSITYDGGSTPPTPVCTHNWVAGTVHNPTCTEQGYTEYECSLCGETKHDDFVAALGHDYGEWQTLTEPTCTEPGSKQHVCKNDSSHVEVEEIPALGHNFVDGVCTVCGAEEGSETTISLDFSSDSYGITTTQGNQTLTGDGATYGFEFGAGTGTGAKYNTDNKYVLFGKAGVYFRNTSAPENSYISAISWTYTSGVSTNVQLSLSYGEVALNAQSSPITSFGKATQNGEVSLTQSDTSKAYFFIYVTNAYNCQFKNFSVTWTKNSTPPTPVTSYTVTDSVANGSLDKASVNEGATLTTTITPDAKYDLPESVSVTMGGVAITADYTNGVVTVVNVTGDIEITAECGKTHGLWEDDPYTVAEARAAIDAGTNLSGAYVSGIISQVDSYNSTYHSITYWISDDGTTTNHLQVYSGKNVGNTDFSKVEDVEVGATVEVTGTLKKYNDTYEFDKNNYLVTYVAPVHVDPVITLSAYKGHLGMSEVGLEITCDSESFSGTPTFSVEGTPSYVNVSVSGSTITLSPKAVGTETLTVKGVYNTQEASKEFKVCVTQHAGSAADPFTVAEAGVVIEALETIEANVSGIISQVDSYDSKYHSITYWISDDGTTTDQLEVYSGKGLSGADFSSKDDVAVGAEVVVSGTLKKYNSVYEFDKNNELVSYVGPTPVVTPELSLSADQGYFGLDGGMSVLASWEGFSADPTLSVEGTPSCVNVSFDDAPQVYFSAKASGTEIVTIKATNGSEVATATFTVVVTEHAGTEADPYSVTDAKLLLIKFDNISGTVKGVISQVVSDSFSEGSASYYISDDGTTTDQLLVTLGKGYGGADFDSISDVAVGTQVFVGGTLFDGGFASGSSIVSLPNAEAFAQTLLDETDTVCTNSEEPGSAKRKLALKKLWGSTGAVGAGYEALTATEKHALIKSAAKEDGSVVEQAMARYDYLVSAYSLDNIIGRTPSSSLVNTQTISNENSVSTSVATSVVIVVAVISITTLAVLVVVKKRKATSR